MKRLQSISMDHVISALLKAFVFLASIKAWAADCSTPLILADSSINKAGSSGDCLRNASRIEAREFAIKPESSNSAAPIQQPALRSAAPLDPRISLKAFRTFKSIFSGAPAALSGRSGFESSRNKALSVICLKPRPRS